MKWKKLLLIGDSNTQFGFSKEGSWVSLLADFLQRKCDVVNRGFSGYNTEHIRKVLPELLEEFEPENTCGLVIALGSNDSANRETSPIQHVPIKRYSENLEAILYYITKTWGLSKDKIIIISPPKIADAKWNAFKLEQNSVTSHFNELVAQYAKECAAFANRNSIKLIDLNRAMTELTDNSYEDLLFDGLHFSAKGGQFLFSLIKPLIENDITKDLNYNYPYWKDIEKVEDIRQIN
jgi:lysophospholipase L1-like esterase